VSRRSFCLRVRAAQPNLKFRCGLFSVGRRGRCSCCYCSRFPATAPPPSKLIESHFTQHRSDHLRSKGPEAVVIETSQPDFLPALPGKKFSSGALATASSDVGRCCTTTPTSLSEQADASDGTPQSPPRCRGNVAQLVPGASDQAGSNRRQFGLASESPPSFGSDPVPRKRQRSARIGVSMHTNKATPQS